MSQFQSKKICEVLKMVENHDLLLPAFQREYVWRTEQVERLFDSLMKGYPINSLMSWRVTGAERQKYKFNTYCLMKNLFILIFVAMLCACSNDVVKEYYVIEVMQPVLEENSFGQYKVSKPSVDVKKTYDYENDSIALVSEIKRTDEWIKSLPQRCEAEIKKAKPTANEAIWEKKVKTIRDAYKELENTKFYLLIFSHAKDYKPEELLSLIKEHGIASAKVNEHIYENKLEVKIKPLN